MNEPVSNPEQLTPRADQAASQSPSYDALTLIVQSICGALDRAGVTDCDDPGEAIDVMRERYEARIAEMTAQDAPAPVASDWIDMVIRDVCELDPADGLSSVSVRLKDLHMIIERHAPAVAPVAGDAVARLVGLMREVVPALESTGLNVSLAADVKVAAAALAQDRASQPVAVVPEALEWLRLKLLGEPVRREKMGGQTHSYLDASEVLGWVEEAQKRATPKPAAPKPAAPDAEVGVDSPLLGKYADVLAPFVAMMEAELHANAGKGDRPGWLEMDRETALLEIYYHVAKLQKAARDDDQHRIRENAADVANMAMMLADVCGVLPPAAQEVRNG
ncbi:hypothetical protein [Luteimonas sp. FCS-9]|uniref:hypothetical protein n=1 Tax=Luteimonas sp. FCS-9 TaxID=1547516 RepID=UPI00063EB470|nr:hypothetical protein [Luteimonas sp. FCS-9]KLJ02859.1 hypothetical protein WQ56_00845 [Luteimonas sp. FCS-9]